MRSATRSPSSAATNAATPPAVASVRNNSPAQMPRAVKQADRRPPTAALRVMMTKSGPGTTNIMKVVATKTGSCASMDGPRDPRFGVRHERGHRRADADRTGLIPRRVRRMPRTTELDPTDLRILTALQNNSRTPNKDLAAAVGIAPSTCLDRVNRLREAGIIRGYKLAVDPEKLGRPLQALLYVRVQPHRRPLVDPFVEHVLAQPEARDRKSVV